MARTLLFTAILALSACVTTPSTPEPVRYSVVRGDTLGEIARAHGVTVDDLRAWNDLEGDLIEVDQVLVIHLAGAPTSTPVRSGRTRSDKKGRSVQAAPPPTGTSWSLPPERPCLPPPEVDLAEDAFATAASQGLDAADVKQVIDAFVPRTVECAPDGWQDSGTLVVDLSVACSGRVQHVEVVSDGSLPAEMVSCLTDRLRFAPFPAHALPDGDRVRVPMHYAFLPPE